MLHYRKLSRQTFRQVTGQKDTIHNICLSNYQVEMETRQFTDKTIHRRVFWRQFTDRFEDSSPTLMKTVHRQFFYHVIDIWLENITDYCEEILMCYDFRWYVDIICWESDILFVWLMTNRQTFDCYMKLYWCVPSYIIFDEIRQQFKAFLLNI